jgi:hypothetical protein
MARPRDTSRDAEILALMHRGHGAAMIARELGIGHVRAQAAIRALEAPPPDPPPMRYGPPPDDEVRAMALALTDDGPPLDVAAPADELRAAIGLRLGAIADRMMREDCPKRAAVAVRALDSLARLAGVDRQPGSVGDEREIIVELMDG